MVTQIKCGMSNCYLLTGDGGSVLIDACGLSDTSAIYEKIKNHNVRLILLTHGHPDHIGSAWELSRRLSAPVAISRKDTMLIENPVARTLYTHTLIGKILKLATKSMMKKGENMPLFPDVWLTDGQDLSEYGVDAKVIALPGHTEGSVGVLTGAGDFFIGDAMFNLFRPTGSLVYENREEMEQSMRKIILTGAKRLWFGHGKPMFADKIHFFGR